LKARSEKTITYGGIDRGNDVRNKTAQQKKKQKEKKRRVMERATKIC
jgi:hypothetical protein